MEEIRNIPAHVAIILDGNGRWAKAKGLPRNAGHLQGAKAVEDILYDAKDMGIKYLTVYAFSTENWSRPEAEVSEDEINDLNEELQKITDKFIKEIDAAVEEKNKEIMTV